MNNVYATFMLRLYYDYTMIVQHLYNKSLYNREI